MVVISKIVGEFGSDILDMVKNFAAKEDYKECSIIKSAEGAKGDGYIGVISFVKIEGETNSGGNKTLHVAVKTSLKSEQYRKDIPIKYMYKTEIVMYSEIFPELFRFQDRYLKNVSKGTCSANSGENGWANGLSKNEDTFPKKFTHITECLYSQSEEMQEGLVFPNLKELGFTLWDRMKPMNEEHIITILKMYARFHAISFAMKDEDPEKFKQLVSKFSDIFMWTYCEAINPIYHQNVENSIKLFDKDGEGKIRECLKKFKEEVVDNLKSIGRHRDEYSVIIHGDCWCNNMMFQYQDNSSPLTPINLCLLDFQASQLGSVVNDLSYFLYACSPCEVLENLDHYLKDVYHDTLSLQLRNYGKDPNVLYPFSKLKEEWKKFGTFGLCTSMLVCRMAYSDAEEVPDLVGAADQGNSMAALEVKGIKNEDLYNRRIRSIILHLYKENCLQC